MSLPARTLEIRSSPHLTSGNSVDTIMWNVVLALLPVTVFAIFAFGLSALVTLLAAVGGCVGTEHLLSRKTAGGSTIGDGSAVITGLLFGLTLPPALPLWMVLVGSATCMAVGKWIFGGLGHNPFNPALVGRAILQAAFPVPMTAWLASFGDDRFVHLPASVLTLPFSQPSAVDAMTSATPLSAWKFGGQIADTADLFFGMTSGSAGETSALLCLVGGGYLIARNMMNWRIPATIFATVAVFGAIVYSLDPAHYPTPQFLLLSGGLMIGALFMATDMVGSPMTHRGAFAYSVLIGVLTVSIRLWGGMPEGMMYAILLGNAATPHLDKLFQPRVFGTAARPPTEAKSPATPGVS